ncbi:putative glyoxylase/bleomycin resistance protein [Nitratireductor aquibiodomus RA22]|uniref:Putative glyoxylase/bleomycin resistance protein n=1 Tax=Nitratireductor aquibiodomus RA22 TaxID=1189611 RepID=I5BRX1_9HYPH|nr:putative glyoxylase/bleomycin resistance protein [Nitratireductor aquibiodomus RA22]
MSRYIALTTLVVRDYDEAIAWYRGKLGFHLLEDTVLSAEKRWVVMAPDAGAPARCFWRRLRETDSRPALAIRQAGACSSSCIRMISGAITTPCGRLA